MKRYLIAIFIMALGFNLQADITTSTNITTSSSLKTIVSTGFTNNSPIAFYNLEQNLSDSINGYDMIGSGSYQYVTNTIYTANELARKASVGNYCIDINANNILLSIPNTLRDRLGATSWTIEYDIQKHSLSKLHTFYKTNTNTFLSIGDPIPNNTIFTYDDTIGTYIGQILWDYWRKVLISYNSDTNTLKVYVGYKESDTSYPMTHWFTKSSTINAFNTNDSSFYFVKAVSQPYASINPYIDNIIISDTYREIASLYGTIIMAITTGRINY